MSGTDAKTLRWVAALAAAACLVPAGAVAASRGAPTAAELERDLGRLIGTDARQGQSLVRLVDADCVRAAGDHYMCSYALVRPMARRECRLIQGHWHAATFSVNFVGRVARCSTLRSAIASLR
jgi:hypothetical protein